MNRIATMAMIATALHETQGNDNVAYRRELGEIVATQDRDALIFMMADGSRFRVTVEEVV